MLFVVCVSLCKTCLAKGIFLLCFRVYGSLFCLLRRPVSDNRQWDTSLFAMKVPCLGLPAFLSRVLRLLKQVSSTPQRETEGQNHTS